MIIYTVSRTIYKNKKVGRVNEHRIFFHSPNMEDAARHAEILASRYKRRYVVIANTYDYDRVFRKWDLVASRAIFAFRSSGKLKPAEIER